MTPPATCGRGVWIGSDPDPRCAGPLVVRTGPGEWDLLTCDFPGILGGDDDDWTERIAAWDAWYANRQACAPGIERRRA
jgi:hypothetical protein